MDWRNFGGSLDIRGAKTQTAGTVITQLIQPRSGHKIKIHKIGYTSGSTVHTLQFLRAQGQTTTSAASAASTNTLTLASTSPITAFFPSLSEPLAANDWLAVKVANSDSGKEVYELVKVSSISGSVVTLSANLQKEVASGAKVFAFYELARTCDAVEGYPAVSFNPTASTLSTMGSESPDSALVDGITNGAPVMVHSDNATAAGIIQYLSGCYTK